MPDETDNATEIEGLKTEVSGLSSQIGAVEAFLNARVDAVEEQLNEARSAGEVETLARKLTPSPKC
ncbi:MAG TPA: hypothetical protein VHQ47_07110 [Phycisphaerae bacterium]|nr:hypothetical protein [Phycisphaerae bacterium]